MLGPITSFSIRRSGNLKNSKIASHGGSDCSHSYKLRFDLLGAWRDHWEVETKPANIASNDKIKIHVEGGGHYQTFDTPPCLEIVIDSHAYDTNMVSIRQDILQYDSGLLIGWTT